MSFVTCDDCCRGYFGDRMVRGAQPTAAWARAQYGPARRRRSDLSTETSLPAKRPRSVLAGPYGHPFHPILVTVPIGAWVASLVFDAGSHIVTEPAALTEGSLWLIALGAIGAMAAAAIGFLDLLAIPTGTRVFRTGVVHMGLNLAVTGAYIGNFLWRRGAENQPGPVAIGPLTLS